MSEITEVKDVTYCIHGFTNPGECVSCIALKNKIDQVASLLEQLTFRYNVKFSTAPPKNLDFCVKE
jgi:hypothetical protein